MPGSESTRDAPQPAPARYCAPGKRQAPCRRVRVLPCQPSGHRFRQPAGPQSGLHIGHQLSGRGAAAMPSPVSMRPCPMVSITVSARPKPVCHGVAHGGIRTAKDPVSCVWWRHSSGVFGDRWEVRNAVSPRPSSGFLFVRTGSCSRCADGCLRGMPLDFIAIGLEYRQRTT